MEMKRKNEQKPTKSPSTFMSMVPRLSAKIPIISVYLVKIRKL